MSNSRHPEKCTLTYRIDSATLAELNDLVKRQRSDRSAVTRLATAEYVTKNDAALQLTPTDMIRSVIQDTPEDVEHIFLKPPTEEDVTFEGTNYVEFIETRQDLDMMAKRLGLSRSFLIRQAVTRYIAKNRNIKTPHEIHNAKRQSRTTLPTEPTIRRARKYKK